MKVVDAATMRELDRRAIEEARIPGAVLMERAGAGLADACAVFASALPAKHARRFVLLAGKGNNGGDAFVAASLLPSLLPRVEVALHCICPPEELKGDAAKMFKRLSSEMRNFARFEFSSSSLRPGDIIVDGLLGTGFSGEPRAPFNEWIKTVNASGLPVIAIDIPSGLDATTGSASCAIEADLTVTMALPKIGMFRGEGPRLCGRLKIVDIGFPNSFVEAAPSKLEATFAGSIRSQFGREPFDSHKNSRGHVLVVGGSHFYPGAPALSASAALKAGAGLVTLAIPEGAVFPGSIPNAIIVRRLSDGGLGSFNKTSLPALRELLAKAKAVAVGPGMSTESSCAEIVRAVVDSGRHAVFDADALNLIAADPSLLKGLNAPCILTPHPGEMLRLAEGFGLKSSGISREESAKALAAETGAVVILKGCRTVVTAPDGRLAVNGSGCPSLATAGSGDCLSGLAATLLALETKADAFEAARAAAFIHGRAGELACPYGSRGLIADEIPDYIVKAMRDINPLA